MLSLNYIFDTNVYLFTYMFIYNVSLTSLFWSLFTVVLTKFKNLYSFSNFSFNYYLLLLLTVLLCSMAGVPPFIGFFSKIFVLTVLTNSSLVVLYSLFLFVLLLGLYFYVQNLRFIHSTSRSITNSPFLKNERVIPVFYYFSMYVTLFLLFGVFYVDDLLLVFTWLLI